MKFNRIKEDKYLMPPYAPNGVAGTYQVLAEVIANFVGHDTIVAHIICVGDKPKRVWMEL